MSQDNDASKDAESALTSPKPPIAETLPASSDAQASRDIGEAEKRSKESVRDADEEASIPETEEALNIPKPQTIGMLASMSALTLIVWFAARLACNAHPDQVREPKHFSTKDLAADPKNAAFEFHHSFETGDYVTALDLASGEVKKLVESKLLECEKTPEDCEENQAKFAGSVKSTGKVLEEVGGRTTVELVSFYNKQLEPKTFQFTVEKQGDFYRVTMRKQVETEKPLAPVTPPPESAGSAAPLSESAPVETPPASDGPASKAP